MMINNKTTKFFATYGDVILRLVAALIFILAGAGKLFAKPGITGFAGMLAGMGFPIPTFFAVLVGIVELVGGVLLLIGLFTRISAAALSIIMVVAILTAHLNSTWAYPVLLLAVLLRYVGAGTSCSLQDAVCKKHAKSKPKRHKKK